ncbi:MAG: hypothetical protein FWH11_05075 [Micrococcales bacterium]|nr:hypothetical protein [Micrococcales bacterium]
MHDVPPDQGALPVGTASSPTPVGTALPPDAAPVDRLPEVGPAPEVGVGGWPERLADHPFGWETTADLAAEPRPRRENPTEPTAVVTERTPSEVEQAEEAHLDWLRHLPERRDEAPAGPPAHSRAEPPPPREPPRREWTERLVVGLIAGLVTLAATRWAGAGWSTAVWIGATVLVVVPTVAWVATLGSRSSTPADRTASPSTRVGT